MSRPALPVLANQLRHLPGLRAKRDIQAPAAVFAHQPFPALGLAAQLGDDAALLPAQRGALLLACEGMQPELVAEDPWFAGWSAVLVNLSDIAAMGGRPLALVNSLWSEGESAATPLLAGLRFACDAFSIPMVGGHTNSQSPYTALSVAVLGVAEGPVLSARAAQAGDALVLLIDGNGAFYRHYPFWDAATHADPRHLQAQLGLLPRLAQAGIARAAKDISMGGLVGTAAMFSEACGLGIEIEREAVERPPGVDELHWLRCFPSFGFLLALPPERLPDLPPLLAPFRHLISCRIGRFRHESPGVWLISDHHQEQLWDGAAPLTGFRAALSP
jgi:AIR synthase-related protein